MEPDWFDRFMEQWYDHLRLIIMICGVAGMLLSGGVILHTLLAILNS